MADNSFMDDMDDDEELYVTLTLDDDQEQECLVLCIFEAEGKDYIALVPADQADDEEADEAEVLLYRYLEDENGEPGIENIESEAEFYLASEAFNDVMYDDEYDDEDDDEYEDDEYDDGYGDGDEE